jgi:hypothetical protein
MAGCILVDSDKIQVINRSHKYKNKYVHRRTSVSLESLTAHELEERRRVGLIRLSGAHEIGRDRGVSDPPQLDHKFPVLLNNENANNRSGNRYSLTHLLTHLLTYLFTSSLTHLLTFLLTH